MEGKTFFIVFLVAVILIGGILLIFLKSDIATSPRVGLETCHVLKDSQGEHNIVFFSSKDDAKEYADFFLQTSPFNEYKDKFNFYFIENYKPKCELYQGIAILCYSKELVKVAGACPNDYIVVLEQENSDIRSSAYMNVMSLNLNHPKSVLIHEFGHAFANLAEEYVPAKIPFGSKNCVSNCEKFDVINNGVMKTLSSTNYGAFNKNLIIKKIGNERGLFSGNVIQEITDCENQQYYLIEGTYSNNKMKILDKSLERGCVGDSGAGDFSFSILDENGAFIYWEDFNPELIFTDAPGEEEIDGETFENQENFYLKIPEVSNGHELQVNLQGQILEKIDLYDIRGRPCKNE